MYDNFMSNKNNFMCIEKIITDRKRSIDLL